MKLNSRGDMIGGQGRVAVNNVTLSLPTGQLQQTEGAWLTDDTPMFQAYGGPQGPGAYTPIGLVVARPVSNLLAGGGSWFVYTAAQGTVSNVPGDWSTYRVADCSPEGIGVLTPWATQRGLQLSTGLSIPTMPLGDDSVAGLRVRLRGNVLWWRDTTGGHLWDIAANAALPYVERPNCDEGCPVPIGDQVWMLERDSRLVLRLATDITNGYILVP